MAIDDRSRILLIEASEQVRYIASEVFGAGGLTPSTNVFYRPDGEFDQDDDIEAIAGGYEFGAEPRSDEDRYALLEGLFARCKSSSFRNATSEEIRRFSEGMKEYEIRRATLYP